MTRRSLSDVTTHVEPVTDFFPPTAASSTKAGAAPPAAGPAPKRARRRPARQEAAIGKATAARPTARELASPARQPVAREALKADVPAQLALLRRLHAYRLDKAVDIRDQVAIAVDEWLTREGY
jgi:hypothetical protein